MPYEPPPIVIEHVERSAELPQSPRLPADRPGVAIEILPALRKDRPTYAILGAVNLTRRQSLLYGPDADQVLRIVAFEPRSGRIVHAEIAGAHAPQIGEMQVFTPPDPPRPPSGAILPIGFGFNFNRDLFSVLNIPGEAGKYTIVAWMEDLISEPRTIDIPEDKARFPARPFMPEPSVSSPINVRTAELSPQRQKMTITARSAPPAPPEPGEPPAPEAEETRGIGRVFVSIGPGVLPAVPAGVEGAPKHVAILAQSALDRRIAARTIRLPAAVFDETGCGEFDFEALDLFPPDFKKQPVFVMIMAGQSASQALTLIPPGWKD